MTQEITSLGFSAAALTVNVRTHSSVQALFQQVLSSYGRVDVLVYNSGAIWWESLANSPMKRFQLLQQVNVEGLYACIQEMLPVLARQRSGRIVVVCPPIYSRFFRGKTAYAVGKVGMSVMVKGACVDLEGAG